MKVFVIEAQIVDHPDFESFVDVKRSLEEAEQIVYSRIQEEIDECGEDATINKTQLRDNHFVYGYEGGLSNIYISAIEV